MRYIVVTLLTYNDNTPDKQSTYKYDSYDEAIARFHSIFGYITNNNVEKIMSIMFNEYSEPIRNEFWERRHEIEESKPEEPEVESVTE